MERDLHSKAHSKKRGNNMKDNNKKGVSKKKESLKDPVDVLYNGNTFRVERNSMIIDFLYKKKINVRKKYICAILNNRFRSFSHRFHENTNILKLVPILSLPGLECYKQTLTFILFKAMKDLYPKGFLYIHHSLNKGLYGELDLRTEKVTSNVLKNIKKRMQEIIDLDLPIERKKINLGEAIELFRKDYPDKVNLLLNSKKHQVSVCRLGDLYDYYYAPLAISTGFIGYFDLIPYQEGFILRAPDYKVFEEKNGPIDQPKLFEIYREYHKWSRILGVTNIGELNNCIVSGEISEIIKVSEAFHEKKLSIIADEITKRKGLRIVLIAGPSSSGKTSFAKRLNIHLRVNGRFPISLSLDNYFLDRSKSPRDKNGNYDFEHIKALDLELLNKNLRDLLAEKSVELPKFDFKSGQRYYDGNKIRLEEDQILIIEGIHGLNNMLTSSIPGHQKYKIYVSALTQLNIDNHNRIPTTDLRLLRRMVRDHHFRGHGALDTIGRWPSVRDGEERWIFPFQENADIIFNSSLIYELAILKRFAEPILKDVPKTREEYCEIRRLLKFLSYFLDISDTEVPPTSLLREFIGRSAFEY